jgi:hypothetical protein
MEADSKAGNVQRLLLENVGKEICDVLQGPSKKESGALKKSIYPALLVALLVLGFHPLREKMSSQKNDKSLVFAFDFDDVAFFGKEELIETLPSIGMSVVMTPTAVSEIDEKRLREKNLQILWKIDDNLDWPSFARRYHDGDGVLLSGENLINRPFFPYELARLIKSHNGFVSLMEFSPVRNSQNFYRLIDGSSRIKSHVLGTREMSVFKPRLWDARLERAAKERWVRLIAVHFSPAVSKDTNVAFQRDLIERFRGLGYHVSNGIPKANGFLSLPSNHLGIRNLLVLFLKVE